MALIMSGSERGPVGSWRCSAVRTLLGLLGCGDDPSSPAGTTATVRFVYEASTTTDPGVAAAFPGCVQGVSMTHIHAGWRGFIAVFMTAVEPDRWEITFSDVPVDEEQRIRVSDPNVCALNPTGASTEGVFANGTMLVRVVDTPGSGVEPGLAFQVSADGTVRP